MTSPAPGGDVATTWSAPIDPNLKAQVLHGDCLARLPELERAGLRFDLIYVDPPFNAGGKRKARLQGGQERASGESAYHDSFGSTDEFIRMLEPRLAAMRDVMSEDGSLWLHLGHQAVHEAKVAAERVFGPGRFQGEVIWVPGNGGRRKSGPAVTHQTIVIFSKSKDMIWNADDPALREPYADTSLKMHFQQTDAAGRAFRERVIRGKAYRYYADEGRRLGSVWSDCPAMTANTPLRKETTGYPTQKPESLLERIVRASSVEGSWVLDPMCGSGTTLSVAQRLGRACVGIDIGDLACQLTSRRLSSASAPRP